MKGPSTAVSMIEEYVSIDMPPIACSVLLERILISNGTHTLDDAQEIAARWNPRFKHLTQIKLNNEEKNDQISTIEFNRINDDYVQGSCYIDSACSENEAEAKRLRSNKIHYVNAFRNISDIEFETTSSRILSLWRVEKDFVTRRSADQGIDFYGRVPFGQIIKPSAIGNGAEKQLKIWLVGQAKNYSATQVSTKDLRELVGSVSLARSKCYAGSKDPLSELDMRICDPVFFLFFTTGNISRDARDLLKKTGVIAMDGSQLATFLADHGIGLVNQVFDLERFRSWAGI